MLARNEAFAYAQRMIARIAAVFTAAVLVSPLSRAAAAPEAPAQGPSRCTVATGFAAPSDAGSAPEVMTDELERLLEGGAARVFDARPHLEYATSHIPGAANVAARPGQPMSLYVSDVKEIERAVNGDKAAAIVLYCNGPFCGKSKRLAAELAQAGFRHVRRYQLGIPVWRALGHPTVIERDGVRYVRAGDRTAVFLDARPKARFAAGTLAGARSVPVDEVAAAKDDGRLPMQDHNTRIVVFGADAAQARAVAAEVAHNAFHNVAFFPGTYEELARDVDVPAPR